MKAIIFSCSLKDAKNSDSQAWSELTKDMMHEQNIDCEIINLKQFDHEASSGPDLLHEEMAKVYDANFIIIAGSVNFTEPNFFLRSLASRFTHAYEQAKKREINLFENKLFEVCIMQGCLTNDARDGEEIPITYGGRPTRAVINLMPPVQYIDQNDLGLHVSFSNITDPRGPIRKDIHKHEKTVADLQQMIESFKKKFVEQPVGFSLSTWMECFKSDDPNAFGRGYTLSKNNLNEESVIAHKKWVNEHIENHHHRAQIWVAMKERCIKNDFDYGANLYFDEQFLMARKGQVRPGELSLDGPKKFRETVEVGVTADDSGDTHLVGDERIMKFTKNGFRITRTANYRPNNY